MILAGDCDGPGIARVGISPDLAFIEDAGALYQNGSGITGQGTRADDSLIMNSAVCCLDRDTATRGVQRADIVNAE